MPCYINNENRRQGNRQPHAPWGGGLGLRPVGHLGTGVSSLAQWGKRRASRGDKPPTPPGCFPAVLPLACRFAAAAAAGACCLLAAACCAAVVLLLLSFVAGGCRCCCFAAWLAALPPPRRCRCPLPFRKTSPIAPCRLSMDERLIAVPLVTACHSDSSDRSWSWPLARTASQSRTSHCLAFRRIQDGGNCYSSSQPL